MHETCITKEIKIVFLLFCYIFVLSSKEACICILSWRWLLYPTVDCSVDKAYVAVSGVCIPSVTHFLCMTFLINEGNKMLVLQCRCGAFLYQHIYACMCMCVGVYIYQNSDAVNIVLRVRCSKIGFVNITTCLFSFCESNNWKISVCSTPYWTFSVNYNTRIKKR